MKSGVVKDPVSSQKLMVVVGGFGQIVRAVVHSRSCNCDGGALAEFRGRCLDMRGHASCR